MGALSAPVTHSLVRALRGVPDFESLDDRALLRIVGASANLFWPAGSTIFEEGSRSDALFVVLSGEVAVVDSSSGTEVEVSRLGPGGSFGEISLLLGIMHTKRALAVQDTELMVLPQEDFRELLEESPALAELFNERVKERQVKGEVPGTS